MKKQSALLVILFISFQASSQEWPFSNEIKAFRTQDSIQKPKDGMLLFIGSSSFRLWKSLKEDFNNPNIVNRAFGGATLEDMIHYKQDIVLKYKPKKIFIYCGDNDLASSEKVTPEVVLSRFKALYESIRKQLPNTPIVYVSIKPSPSRWAMKDKAIEANALISSYLKDKKNTIFVNIWDNMLENGEPKKDIFLEDKLHMNKAGYAIWIKEMKAFVN